MKKNQKYMAIVCCLLCLCLCLAACNNPEPTTTTQPPKDAIYTITVETAGGMTFDGLAVYVYEDNTEDDLLTFGTLDESGSFTFTAPESSQYTVRFPDFPAEGYDLQEYYTITSSNTHIKLTSGVIAGKDALEKGKTYQLGDVMRDFTVTTVDGEELTLSKLLEQKQAVMLNFWYTGCDPCKAEFPLMQAAYEAYGESIEIITMNPIEITGDTAESIIQFRDDRGLTMPMATCSSQWLSALGVGSYPTTVIIDRYGVICLLTTGSVDDQAVFEAAFEHFGADTYEQKLLQDFSELHVVEYPVGHARNPYQTHGAVGEFEITVEPGAEFYTMFFKASGVTLRIEDPSAYMIYGEDRFDPNKNGVVELELPSGNVMAGESVIIGNTGVTAVTFKVQVIIPQGTYSNPYEGSLGENKVTIKDGNDQGVFYNWVAEADGVLTLTITDATSDLFDIQLYNLNTYAVRTLNEEEHIDEEGRRFVSVEVHAGDVVSIGYQSVPDENNKYSKVTIDSLLSFSEGGADEPMYSITVMDGEGNPMAGISVNVNVDGINTVFVSDETGLIVMDLPAGMYTVKVTVPEGYECETTQFLLTDSNPTKEIVMTLYVPQEIPYTVYVVDEQGKPVPNVTVVLGDSFAYTDAKGMVSVILLESKDYVATIIPPEGYIIENNKHAFGSQTVITVVVSEAPEVQQEIDYTVQVVDGKGDPFTNLLVRFDSDDGTVSVTEPVDDNGRVKVRLLETSYTVTLVFNAGNSMGYEPANVRLTPSNPSATVLVAPCLGEATGTVFVDGEDRPAYDVGSGFFYLDLTAADTYYFLFTAEEAGVYEITTTNPAAKVGYWSTPFFTFDASSEYVKDNVCTIEIKNAGPTYVISVTGGEGITGAILKIVRTGDVQENPMVYETYVGETTPTAPYVADVTGTKTYLELTTEQTLVKGDDGYYHLGTADGPLVFMDLKAARYGISISAVVNNSPMLKYEFDAEGKPIKRIDYTTCMLSYVNNTDQKLGVYPLTDDLVTMVRNHGDHAGWYEKGSHGYIFDTDPVLEGQGWMFLLCVFQ